MKQEYTLKTHYFKLKLKHAITVNNHVLTHREGYYCLLHNKNTLVGVGEIAALPGLSKESIKIIQKELSSLTKLTVNISNIDNRSLPLIDPLSHHPSIQFGIESAIMMNLFALKTVPCHIFVPNLKDIPALENKNLLKCKIGRLKPSIELDIIKKMIHQFPYIKFRFDANNRLTFDEALTFFTAIPKHHIDYIEAPCQTKSEEKQFFNKTSLPIAYDCPKTSTEIPSYCNNIVIKPTIMGSLKNYISYFKHNKTIIFSSSYESIIGLSGIARLATYLSPKQTHGLNTNHIFHKTPNTQVNILKPLTLEESISWINKHGSH